MSQQLCITVRFLLPFCHGRGDGGRPEWPPSPLRLFQALVSAAGAKWNERERLKSTLSPLRWLELQPSPTIIAVIGTAAKTKHRLYVPDNVADKVAAAWSRGNEASIADYRTEKDVHPTHLSKDDAVHYLFPVTAPENSYEVTVRTLTTIARCVTHFGWGVDMVVGDARLIDAADANRLPGERWSPVENTNGLNLRVPISGTLDDLIRKHEAFLNRIARDEKGAESFRPVPPLTVFRTASYRRATDVSAPQVAAFHLLKLDGSGYQPFDTVRKTMVVAGMMRNAASRKEVVRALGFESEAAAGFLHGHGESRGESLTAVTGPRLAYLPLPSLEYRGEVRGEVVGSIRRALITVVGGDAENLLLQTARLLSATPLIDERKQDSIALLSRIPTSDKMVRRYTDRARSWSTVTPVILPGYDDPRGYRRRLRTTTTPDGVAVDAQEQRNLLSKLDHRIDYLLRKAIRQAGFSEELAKFVEIEWRSSGFRAGTAMAANYEFPNQLRRYRRLHVRITWRDAQGSDIEVPGPICLGAGRFCGLGLFAAEEC